MPSPYNIQGTVTFGCCEKIFAKRYCLTSETYTLVLTNSETCTLFIRSDDDYALRSDVLDDSHEIPQVWAPPVDEVSRRYTRSSAVDMSNGGEQGMWHGSVATFSDQYGSDERRHRAYNQICDAHDTADSDNVLRGHDDNTELHEKPIPVASGRIVPLSLRRGDPTHSSIIPLILHSGRRHGIDSTAPNGASAYACLVPVPPLLRLSAPQRLQPSSARRRLMLCLPPSTFSARQQRNASIKGTESFNRPMPLNNTTDSREHLFPNGENVPCPDPAGIVSSSPTLRGRAYPPAGAPPVCTAPVATAAHERNAVPDSPSNIATTPEGTAEPSPASVSQGHLSRLRRNWIAIAERFDAHHRATHEHSNAERRTQLVGTHSWRTARAPPDAAVTTGATPTAPPPETAVTASPAPVEPWGDNRTLPACSGGAEATCTREHVAIRSDTGGNTPRTTTHTPAPAVTWQSPAPRQHVAERAPADRRALLPHDNAYSQPLPAALVDVLLTDIRYPCERTLVCDIGDNHGAAFASSATGQTLLAH